MFSPPHPGESLDELYFKPLNLDVNSTAAKLAIEPIKSNIKRKTQRTPIIPIKLAKVFGGTALSWLNQQSSFDLWHAQQEYSAKDVRVIYKPRQSRILESSLDSDLNIDILISHVK